MFRTYKHAELELPNLFSGEYQVWHFVELGLHRPWFYAGTREGKGDDVLVTMKMIPNIEVLECLLNEHADVEIESLQVVSPGYINGSSGWMMESLLELSLLADESGRASGYRCRVGSNKSYDVLDLRSDATPFKVKRVLYRQHQ